MRTERGMKNIIRYTIVAVVLISVLKTIAVQHLLLDGVGTPLHIRLAVFGIALTLTATVLGGVFQLVRQRARARANVRSFRPLPDDHCKDDIIRHYRTDWNLSDAEVDVAIFALKGFSNNEIAELRATTVTTVKTQLSAVYQKSGLRSRYQLIAFVTDEMLLQSARDGRAPRQPALAAARRTPAHARKYWPVAQ